VNTTVVSYSMTGNNRALAQSVAKKLSAKHIDLTENKKRSMGTIVKDMLLGLAPRVEPAAETLTDGSAVILVGPIWMGQIATPLRSYMKRLKNLGCPYAFLTISGGADGPNVKLAGELKRRIKRDPAVVIDLLIAGLLPKEPKPRREDTSAYKLTEEDVAALTEKALSKLEVLTKEG
jgi:hypothetical protein